MTQAFLYPPSLHVDDKQMKVHRERKVYIIRDGIDFNLAFISQDFKVEHKKPFDTNYMRKLFDHGYQLARKGYPWQKYPPGFTP